MDIVKQALNSIKRNHVYLKDVNEQPQQTSPPRTSKPLMESANYTTEGASSSSAGPVAAAKSKSGKSGG